MRLGPRSQVAQLYRFDAVLPLDQGPPPHWTKGSHRLFDAARAVSVCGVSAKTEL